MRGQPLLKLIASIAAALFLLTACSAIPPEDPDDLAAWEEANDPWEDYNRYMFEVNFAFDQLVLRPFAGWYRTGVPEPLRDAITSALRNARSPLILIHDLLQGDLDRARVTLLRFLTNTTLGIGGFMDVAKWLFDMEFHNEDMGQTLGVWGWEEGWYIILPLFGPSNPRDFIGLLFDSVLDPVGWGLRLVEGGPIARSVLSALDLRSRNLDALDDIQETSIDYYATVRSLYRQRRQDEINNGVGSTDQFAPSLSQQGPGAGDPFAANISSNEDETPVSILDDPAFESLDDPALESLEDESEGAVQQAGTVPAPADEPSDLKSLLPMLESKPAPVQDATAVPGAQQPEADQSGEREVLGLPWLRDQQAQLTP
ncbi:MAG: MlaA family lipoprotein [Alphaproteobacteria bacterium]|nr:MlaA family lipoprotein [Alphaproteobacteria bacterium]